MQAAHTAKLQAERQERERSTAEVRQLRAELAQLKKDERERRKREARPGPGARTTTRRISQMQMNALPAAPVVMSSPGGAGIKIDEKAVEAAMSGIVAPHLPPPPMAAVLCSGCGTARVAGTPFCSNCGIKSCDDATSA